MRKALSGASHTSCSSKSRMMKLPAAETLSNWAEVLITQTLNTWGGCEEVQLYGGVLKYSPPFSQFVVLQPGTETCVCVCREKGRRRDYKFAVCRCCPTIRAVNQTVKTLQGPTFREYLWAERWARVPDVYLRVHLFRREVSYHPYSFEMSKWGRAVVQTDGWIDGINYARPVCHSGSVILRVTASFTLE